MVRVLLDEDLDVRLRLQFGTGVKVETVLHRGWKGKKNGELLRLAEKEFDVLLTGDGNLPFQQNLSQYDLAVVVLRPRKKSLSDLVELVPSAERILATAVSGQVVEVFPPEASGAE